MKIELSQEAIRIIRGELQTARNTCLNALAALPARSTGSEIYRYWESRLDTIDKALREFHEN